MADYLRFGNKYGLTADVPQEAGKFTAMRCKQQSRISAALLF
ncbi:hypothetical protein ALQ95_100970 [Pseudomonas syringae pv. ribicola]|jgi:hypothetical protein|uniref:Uncharacterized protein n=1 Tax=Pseudomonas syringae pv. ribicola TaxID=55398 RepID=A0A3M2W0Y9_PSESI|nr:hypothetical protein ALQ95_100970 [Pseudomonas syringae pv. ribicola]